MGNTVPTIFSGGVMGSPDIITTANGGTTVIDNTASNVVVATGSGILHAFEIDDARNMRLGLDFTLVNASSEFIGIDNSDNSVWVRLGPHEECQFELIDNTTEPGTWRTHIKRIQDPRFGVRVIDDFLGGASASAGPLGFSIVNSGSGSGSWVSGSVTGSYSTGLIYQTAGSAPTGSTVITSTPAIQLGIGPVRYVDTVIVLALSTAIEEYAIRLGLCDGNAADAVDGVYFEYDRATHGDNNWRICTASNSTRTKSDSGIQPNLTAGGTGVFQIPSIEVCSDASRADFFIGDTHVGNISTNIPTGVARVTKIQKSIVKSVGTTPPYSYSDFVEFSHIYDRY